MSNALNKIIISITPIGILLGSILGGIVAFIIPVQHFIYITFFLVLVDLIVGVQAAKHRNEKIKSKGLANTVYKLMIYLLTILSSRGVSIVFAPEAMQQTMYLSYAVAGVICLREFKSILENAEEVTGAPLISKIALFEKLFNNKK